MEKSSDHMKLDQLGTRFPFHTPEHYFDDFPSKVMDSISVGMLPHKEISVMRFLKPAIGLVASLLIIFGLIYIPGKVLFPEKNGTVQFVSPTFDEEFMITYPLADNTIFEALENTVPDDLFDKNQLETVLLASVNEYELMDLTN
jgi:hypothetical protein